MNLRIKFSRGIIMAFMTLSFLATTAFAYYDSDGSKVARITAWPIPAFGSIEEPLFDLFQQELDGGTLVIETEQPVTAFLLYDNKSTTWKAGLSAVPVD